jgi:hypothetical protein
MNTKKGKNSLDNEGANVAFCRLFMNRKSVVIGHTVLRPLNCVVQIAHFH